MLTGMMTGMMTAGGMLTAAARAGRVEEVVTLIAAQSANIEERDPVSPAPAEIFVETAPP